MKPAAGSSKAFNEENTMSPLQKHRSQDQPKLPAVLANLASLSPSPKAGKMQASEEVLRLFPKTSAQHPLQFVSSEKKEHQTLVVGVVFSGGQASGGHNVIAGLSEALKKLNPDSRLIGFLNGPDGIIRNKTMELTPELIASYRNQGGFDLIGSGRTKIETEEQFQAAEKSAREHNLDGLVIIGGDDSNTNAALLAEYFTERSCKTAVVGVPKTIDGDLKNAYIESSFGFDTACKTYSEIIGNILRDSLSAKKYTFFIKLMGRSASHVALECALQTHCNLTLIGEEIEAKRMTLADITDAIADLIAVRSAKGKDYGVILIPEGIVEFIPEVRALIQELNTLLAKGPLTEELKKQLTPESQRCFTSIPAIVQAQLLMERDPHGNVQVTKIETERLLVEMVQQELNRRAKAGTFTGKFSPVPLFCGYEGRSAFPSLFDAHYCYALGHVAALLVSSKATGYMSVVSQLKRPVSEWQIGGIPLVQMMHQEMRKGKMKPVIRKALVDLDGKPFSNFKELREAWMLADDYRYPGPIQLYGPEELTNTITLTLALEQ
ncbi:MAG: diphosphate--fructose-6-phosphate 1-phosphotransferase [Parachlamydia sp.]|nr:diphosphate--fructose-6-phosphate 1-phosphotransferase [Parachlamydia sp.]